MKKKIILCPKCGKELRRETNKELKKEYPFVCYSCNENFYTIEAITLTEIKAKK